MVDNKSPRKQNKFFGGICYVTGLVHIPVNKLKRMIFDASKMMYLERDLIFASANEV